MKTNIIGQEILLITSTSFLQRQYYAAKTDESIQNRSLKEQLEEAIWTGVLKELLPGIINKEALGKSLYLWQILHGQSFLEIKLSEYPLYAKKNCLLIHMPSYR